MNLPGHRIGACLGKAALKTHALQTPRAVRRRPAVAKRLGCVRFIGAFCLMFSIHASKRKESCHESSLIHRNPRTGRALRQTGGLLK